MNGKELRVGFACTGSFCTFGQVFPVLEETAKRFGTVIPILSEYSAATDTRFGKARILPLRWSEFVAGHR